MSHGPKWVWSRSNRKIESMIEPGELKSRSLEDWLSYLEQMDPSKIELGLERVRQVAERLELLPLPSKVVLIGGTNGKGSTAAIMEQILISAGYSVGVYSSPHLLRYTERVRINGREAPPEQHCRAFAEIEQIRGDIPLTYFEFGTLSALSLFKRQAPQVVLLEVGLGGRGDATNIVEPDVAVITTIALDHTDWLGDSREQIGLEKAGILRRGVPAVIGEPDLPGTVREYAMNLGAELVAVGEGFGYALDSGQSGQSWHWQGAGRVLRELPLPKLPLANAATALAALTKLALPLSDEVIREGIAQASLTGRFQLVATTPVSYVDVAHNPESAALLADRLQALREQQSGRRVLAVVGMLKDKDVSTTLEQLEGVVDSWYPASLKGPRGAAAEMLQAVLEGDRTFASVTEAWQAALADARPEQDVVIGFGSFYTVAEILLFIQKTSQKTSN